ncbi:MAG: hypothetical protein FJW66_06005 [Actinobacteria bacterium]|nr:hypothetical protein [Actinomycetota bacterium]
MGIKIEKITVKNLGPIQNFSEKLGLFNLIFSSNECGKTFLTEFIIRSLFKNTKRWKFRENGSGKVTVTGLDGQSPVEFSPVSAKKLEDWWQQEEKGMPASMAELLVSKGGEASIEESDEGIGKNLIKEIFSGISLLDKIDSDANIQPTVKKAQLDGISINIANTGEGRTYRQLESEISRIDSLFEEIESKYTKGVLEAYKTEQKQLKLQAENLYKAKCHEAFVISEEIRDLNKILSRNDEGTLAGLASDVSLYERDKAEYAHKNEQFEELITRSANYEWLSRLLPLYEKFSIDPVKKPKIIFAVISAIFVVAAIIFSLFNIPIGTVISLLAASGLITYYIIRLAGSLKNAAAAKEIAELKKEFKTRTGNELTEMASLNLEIEKQRESYDNSKLLAGQLEELKTKIQSSVYLINQRFFNLTGKHIAEPDWQAALDEKKEESREINIRIGELRAKLADLAVREVEYLHEGPGIEFSYEESEKVSASLEVISSAIAEIEKNIGSLKYGICNETNDDQSIGWEHLLENLRKKRLEKQNEYDICKARIIAGILVHSEIEALRREEDEKISEGLKSETVTKPLAEITGDYKRLFLDGETLMVSDDVRDYCIGDLSTGAREQIMLALRIGFAARILKQESLFLILDDAFQHSDWKRRETLVSKLAEIAEKGWQIIYLSMDNHIKSLFDKAGKKFREQYRLIELSGS